MVSSSNIRICYRDVVPFAAMVMIECIIVGGNTLFKSATSQGLDSYVFTTYVFLVGFIFLIPCAFILFLRRIPQLKLSIVVKLFLLSLIGYLSQIFGYVGIKYSSPTLSSVMSNLAPAFTFILAFVFRMERLNFRSHTSQAKIVGTVVSISGALVATLPAQIMVQYPVELMVVFVFGLSGLIVAAIAGLVMVRAWKLKPDMMLASIIYMGGHLYWISERSIIQVWLKGPVYVAMFKPFSIVVAIVMGVGDSLHLGSVVGGTIISLGFYAVLWGKAKEDGSVHYRETLSTETGSSPLLQAHALEEGAGSDPNN